MGARLSRFREPANVTHELVVVTGDKRGASADNINVTVTFTDIDGKEKTQTVTDRWHNDFDRKKPEIFRLDLEDLGKIQKIGISRGEANRKDAWYIDHVEVNKVPIPASEPENEEIAGIRSVFPLNRWMEACSSITIFEFDSTLPQHDLNLEQRKKELRERRQKYILSGKILGVPPQVESLPVEEAFSKSYEFDITSQLAKNKLKSIIIDATTPNFTSLEDFDSIYKLGFPVPKNRENWKCDKSFGQQVLSGCNPVLIEHCHKIPEHFSATPELVEPHLEEKSLEDALAGGKIFIIDLRYLAKIECSEDRELPGPTCLFYQRDNGDLVPVAIQLMPEPAEDNPVFTPSDPEYTWLAAKMWFNLADCSHHQSVTHLGFTHLLMESVAVCANRRLSPSHPIFRLMAPHFLYIMAINSRAIGRLVGPGGWVDRTMQIGRLGMFNIIRTKWAEWDFKTHGNFMNDLKRRGVDKEGTLPNYHYRDDATLLWQAIERYVTVAVNGVYDSADKLLEDKEIHAWCKELTEICNFKGLPQSLTTNEELIEVVTVFIFISSVGHAAANFEQYDQYGFPPNYPSTIQAERPTTKEALTEEYVVKSLPPKETAIAVLQVAQVLSERGTNPLGDYEVQYAHDPITTQALKKFQDDLKEVAATIDKRNSKREKKYEYLNPREVPNAISI